MGHLLCQNSIQDWVGGRGIPQDAPAEWLAGIPRAVYRWYKKHTEEISKANKAYLSPLSAPGSLFNFVLIPKSTFDFFNPPNYPASHDSNLDDIIRQFTIHSKILECESSVGKNPMLDREVYHDLIPSTFFTLF